MSEGGDNNGQGKDRGGAGLPGCVVLSRGLFSHEVWRLEPFCRQAAWVDLIGLANDRDRAVVLNGMTVEVKRGDLARSCIGLAKRWGWDWKKVRGWLAWLEGRGMVRVKTDHKMTVVTVVNYCAWQDALGELAESAGRTDGEPKVDGGRAEGDGIGNREGKGERARVRARGSSGRDGVSPSVALVRREGELRRCLLDLERVRAELSALAGGSMCEEWVELRREERDLEGKIAGLQAAD